MGKARERDGAGRARSSRLDSLPLCTLVPREPAETGPAQDRHQQHFFTGEEGLEAPGLPEGSVESCWGRAVERKKEKERRTYM